MYLINKIINFYKNIYKFIVGLVWPKNDHETAQYPPLCIKPGMVTYLVNDPSYPNLFVSIDNPSPQGLGLNVKFYIGSTDGFDSPQGKAANVYGLLCHGINTFQKKTGLSKWAMTPCLQVDPLAGMQANAYYDRSALKFFYFTKNNIECYTCLSSDIVSHELGHAILDAIRPDFFSTASMEIWSFHEAFGDICSILCTLHHDSLVDYMLAETQLNLRQKNIVSKLAEQMGVALGSAYALRDANNDFKYVKPATLPTAAPAGALANEPHSFSRVMTGVFYEVLCEIFEAGGKTKQALLEARDYLLDVLIDTCTVAPASANFYETFCQAWLKIDASKSKSYQEILKKVFENRNIFQIRMMETKPDDSGIAKEHVMSLTKDDMIIEKCKLSMSVSDVMGDMMGMQSQDSEIMNLKVQLCVDEMYLTEDGGKVNNLCYSISDAVAAARDLIQYITDQNLYGDEEFQSWTKDHDNNLVRKFFNCDCFTNNSLIPGNPEYGKGYKPKNNSGCCSYGSCANVNEEEPKKIEKNCNLRYHSSCGSVQYRGKC